MIIPQAIESRFASPRPVSIVVTTFGCDTRYTQLCLERIACWKSRHHELIVVVHDPTTLLRVYLQYLSDRGVIDKLLLAPAGHGHLRSANLGFKHASRDIVFNVNTDMRIGPAVIGDCTELLLSKPRVGLIGWHYDWSPTHDGTFWQRAQLSHTIRTREGQVRRRGFVDREHIASVKASRWYTGRVFRAVGDKRILCVNTSFFGIRKCLWRRIGGFDTTRGTHYWADDLLCYAVLDLGYDILNLEEDIRCSQRSDRFLSLSDHKYMGIPEPERNLDRLDFMGDREQGAAFVDWVGESIRRGAHVRPSLLQLVSRPVP